MRGAGLILQRSALISLSEFFDFFSPHVYVLSWVPRVLFQLAFFALIARFVGGNELFVYALVGGTAQGTSFAVITWAAAFVLSERSSGIIPLMVAAPSEPLVVMSGRNIAWAGHGLLSGLIILGVVIPFVGLTPSPLAVLAAAGLLLFVALSSYAFGLVVGSVALRWDGWQNVLSIVSTLPLTILGGVFFPVSELPSWAQGVSNFLPIRHGLTAIREVLANGSIEIVLREAALELAVGVMFFVLAQISIKIFLVKARAEGTLDFH